MVLVVVFCASILAGCGGGEGSSTAWSGKYVIASMDENGTVTNLEELESMFELMDMKLEDAMYLEFKSDGKFDMALFGETVSGTYKADGNAATLSAAGETIDASIEGNTITLEQDGTKMVFKK